MKDMQNLHEAFIEKAQRRMDFGDLPIKAREAEVPVLATERWKEVNGALYKTYKFRQLDDRDNFITSLLAYEQNVEHNAEITISGEQVSLKLQTKDIKKPTEIDKEYAKYADVLFRDIVYSSGHVGQAI